MASGQEEFEHVSSVPHRIVLDNIAAFNAEMLPLPTRLFACVHHGSTVVDRRGVFYQ